MQLGAHSARFTIEQTLAVSNFFINRLFKKLQGSLDEESFQHKIFFAGGNPI